MRGPRPLPNPFTRTDSNPQNLNCPGLPSHSGTAGSINDGNDEDEAISTQPSRKALGKRPVIIDEDSEYRFRLFINDPQECLTVLSNLL